MWSSFELKSKFLQNLKIIYVVKFSLNIRAKQIMAFGSLCLAKICLEMLAFSAYFLKLRYCWFSNEVSAKWM